MSSLLGPPDFSKVIFWPFHGPIVFKPSLVVTDLSEKRSDGSFTFSPWPFGLEVTTFSFMQYQTGLLARVIAQIASNSSLVHSALFAFICASCNLMFFCPSLNRPKPIITIPKKIPTTKLFMSNLFTHGEPWFFESNTSRYFQYK